MPQGYSLVGTWEQDDRAPAPAVEPGTAADDPAPEGFEPPPDPLHATRAGGMGRRRVLVHASGFTQSPYADVKPSGTGAAEAPRKLWHSSPGSSGR